ncbi:head maturation protease, ClpP-related [Brachyspira sp.]|uniref:head maturation protease, ClpP-related n=1 Tax=Brachyspira sp. TaxID=1977261 RepID=UPI003D7E79FB
MNENRIVIEGIIGWDFTPHDFRKKTENMQGDLKIEIASPGGFVYDGIEIFNLIRDYSNKKGQVEIIINGLCASISSYIALAGNKLIAYDNAVYMIHNVYCTTVGDYRELNKQAKELEAITNLLAKIYANKTNLDIKEIRKLMDEESFYYGEEILNNGYADEIVKAENGETSNKDEAYLVAKNRINACFNKMHESEKYKDDLNKAVALMQINMQDNSTNKNNGDINEDNKDNKNNKKDGNIMNINELKEKYPELYAEILNLGIAQGKEEGRKEGIELERKRVMAHVTLGKQANAIDISLKYIESGESITNDNILAEYQAKILGNMNLQNRINDNADNQNVSNDEEMQAKATQEFEAKLKEDLKF